MGLLWRRNGVFNGICIFIFKGNFPTALFIAIRFKGKFLETLFLFHFHLDLRSLKARILFLGRGPKENGNKKEVERNETRIR